MAKRILHVVSNVGHYADPTQSTGLWLSELTHAHDVFAAKGYSQAIMSPKGGVSPSNPAPSDGRFWTLRRKLG